VPGCQTWKAQAGGEQLPWAFDHGKALATHHAGALSCPAKCVTSGNFSAGNSGNGKNMENILVINHDY